MTEAGGEWSHCMLAQKSENEQEVELGYKTLRNDLPMKYFCQQGSTSSWYNLPKHPQQL